MTKTSKPTTKTTVTGSAAELETGLPTVAGIVPPELAHRFASVPIPALPTVSRLPAPRERCPISGASRTWLIETNETLGAHQRFLFRVRQRGKVRGAVFVNVTKLLAFLQKAEAEDAAQAGAQLGGISEKEGRDDV